MFFNSSEEGATSAMCVCVCVSKCAFLGTEIFLNVCFVYN